MTFPLKRSSAPMLCSRDLKFGRRAGSGGSFCFRMNLLPSPLFYLDPAEKEIVTDTEGTDRNTVLCCVVALLSWLQIRNQHKCEALHWEGGSAQTFKGTGYHTHENLLTSGQIIGVSKNCSSHMPRTDTFQFEQLKPPCILSTLGMLQLMAEQHFLAFATQGCCGQSPGLGLGLGRSPSTGTENWDTVIPVL